MLKIAKNNNFYRSESLNPQPPELIMYGTKIWI